MHVSMITDMKRNNETTDDVKAWFLRRAGKFWPVADGSISFRKCPCARRECSICDSGGHGSHLLQGKLKGKRFTVYVPGELAPKVEKAIERGRAMQELVMEAGERYTRALKRERQLKRKLAKTPGRDR